jgi:hypothetical protein
MYVGSGFDPKTGVKLIRTEIGNVPFIVCPNAEQSECDKVVVGGDSTTLKTSYDSHTGMLSVTLNLSAFADDFKSAAKDLCAPETFCQFSDNKCVGKPGGLGNLTQSERDITCGRAGEDADCPQGGCVGFSVTLPAGFVAQDQTTANDSALVKSLATCFPKDENWDATRKPSDLAGACVGETRPSRGIFALPNRRSPPSGAESYDAPHSCALGSCERFSEVILATHARSTLVALAVEI